MKELQVRNRQRDRTIDPRMLRRIAAALLENLLGISDYELGIHLVSARTSAQLNQQFLQHEGPTDVITFDFREGYTETAAELSGEIHISVAVAEKQAREFETNWQEELVRYIVHGVLHLRGYDDLDPDKRRIMKREENRLLKRLAGQFDFTTIAR
jgi:probable rRNA maturation factor